MAGILISTVSELETASFEPHLAQAVAKNAIKALNNFCVKCEHLVRNRSGHWSRGYGLTC